MSLYPKEGNSDWAPREIPKPHPIIPSHEPLPPILKKRVLTEEKDESDKLKKADSHKPF